MSHAGAGRPTFNSNAQINGKWKFLELQLCSVQEVFLQGSVQDTQFKVSKQNSILDLIDPYRILWKAVFDESRMYGLEGDLSYLSRSTLQYGVKKQKK